MNATDRREPWTTRRRGGFIILAPGPLDSFGEIDITL